MSRGFLLYDDAVARAAEPFALTRPFGELRAGALLIRERWERLLGVPAAGFIGARHLADFSEFGSPKARITGTLPAGTMVVNARFAPALVSNDEAEGARARRQVPSLSRGESLRSGGQITAVALAAPTPVAALADGTTTLEALAGATRHPVHGWWLEAAWAFVRLLPEMLADDAAVLATDIPDEPPAHVSVLGAHRLAAEPGAYFEPQVVVDTTGGAVVVRAGVRVGAFTRLAGPCVIGEGTQVAGGRFSCCSIGEHSRVCGEMSVAIVAGYANKAHDGFVGHSIVGRWANLGAGTITSNLKNSYGAVRVTDSRGTHDTGMQFFGALIGDHAKTAIGTRFMTGTIVGAGANVFGDRSPAKFVPPFAWGDGAPFKRYARDKFLAVATHVMRRRAVKMSAGLKRALAAAWRASAAPPTRQQPRGPAPFRTRAGTR